MIFQERKTDTGYMYSVQDVFGTIDIVSNQKLTSKLLDDMVSGILQANGTIGRITPNISFEWKKEPMWLPEEPAAEHVTTLMFEQAHKSRTTALLWCLFFGGLGLHRFYVGKSATGTLQIILTLSVFGIIISGPWALIDFIRIAIGTFTDKNGVPLK